MKFYSQNGQDQIIYNNFFVGKKNKGVFIEIGADNGIDNSNTLFFEESLGWEGICIEPRPKAFAKLTENRRCLCKCAAISNKNGVSSFYSITGYGKGLSGLIESYDERHKARISHELSLSKAKDSSAEVINVEVIRLEDILLEQSITEIDFCSIDTEGSEFEIVQSINFSKFRFNILLIENNYREKKIRKYLDRNGFIFYGSIGADDIFINRCFAGLDQITKMKDIEHCAVPVFRFQEGNNGHLFVFLTGVPKTDLLYDSNIFEWRNFAANNLKNSNRLFLRDLNNRWYLDFKSKEPSRKAASTLIESFRQMLGIAKSKVVLVGVSAGGSACLDIASKNGYKRGVAFSAQVDLHADSQLLEKHGETWRLRYALSQKVIREFQSTDLSATIARKSSETSLFLVWGKNNNIDHIQHKSLQSNLTNCPNIVFHMVDSSNHNCVEAINVRQIKSILKGDYPKVLSHHSKEHFSFLPKKPFENLYKIEEARPVRRIIEDTPAEYKGIGNKSEINKFLNSFDNPLLVSFPRTGSHWLRMLIELYFDKPLLTRSFFKHDHNHYLLLHDHDLTLSVKAKQVVYLYRNPVDTIYSQMKYHNEDMNDRQRISHWTDLYSSHIAKWLYDETYTDQKIVLRYEDLVADPLLVLERLANFFHIPYNKERAQITVRKVTKDLVKSKTYGHDPQVQNLSAHYEDHREKFCQKHSGYIWERLVHQRNDVGVAFGILPIMTDDRIPSLDYDDAKSEKRTQKIVGLIAVRNEENIIAQCLKALSLYTDAIVVLDDASEDSTLEIIESLQHPCKISTVIRKKKWYRDEPGDRNRLLQAGREIGGTHFISLDADEMFTANLLDNQFLRKQILSLQPGDCLALVWICLWRSILQYRFDKSVWSNNYKTFVFADDGKSKYSSDFIHTGRAPNNLKGKTKILRGYDHGVLHFQFVNWRNLLIKQAWYRCLEKIRLPNKSCEDINRRYSHSKNEKGLGLKPIPLKWYVRYSFFDESVYMHPDTWRENQVLGWFHEHGRETFRHLDIWDIDWGKKASLSSRSIKRSVSSGDPVAELSRYTQLLEHDPHNVDLLFKIGMTCLQLGRDKDATDFFYSVLYHDSNHCQAREALTSINGASNKTILSSYPGVLKRKKERPLVSAIISTYNAERFIAGCLDDLLSQTISDHLEIIIVDSGSEQNEAAIIREYQARYDNIRYLRTEHCETVYAAWNRGIKASRGKYITNANTDDRHKTDAFEIQAQILDRESDISLVYADCLITETENEVFDNCTPVGVFKWLDWDRKDLLSKGCFMGPQPMWRRSLHDEYGYFDPNFVTSGDYEFWLRISQTHNFHHIPQYLGLYLRSPYSIEHRNRQKQVIENRKLLKIYRTAANEKRIIRRKDNSFTSQEKTLPNTATSIQPVIELVENENYDIAKTHLKDLISNHPDHWEAYELLVDVMLQSGQDMDIPNQLQDLENQPNLPARIMALIGHGYEATGNLEKAAAFTDQALSVDSECARAWNLKGVIAYRNGNGSDAAQFFHKASECDDNWGDPWTNMGTLHWDHGDQDKSLDCFETGFQLSPTSPNVAATYHIAVSQTDQYERARKIFEDVVSRHPAFRKGRFLLVDVLIRLEAYLAALDQIEAALVRFGADAQLLEAAKAVRAKVGPLTIKKNTHPPLSLCMIVKNEEKYLARCLASLKPIVDEMIIVDTGSTDTTRDIAEVFGAKVFDYEWNDDFAAARNHSLEKASGDWILIMDADEVIATQDHEKILELIRNSSTGNIAYLMTTRNYTDRQNSADYSKNSGAYEEERSTGWIPSKKVRLFRNQQKVRFVFPVHEQVDPVLTEMGVSLIDSPIPVHHYGKLDRARTSERWQTYYDIGHKKLASQPDTDHALKELAIQAGLLSKWEEAATHWKSFIDRNPDSADGYLNLTRVMANCGDYEQANRYAKKAFQLAGYRSETIYNLALSELQTGQAAKAAQTANRMAGTFPDDPDGKLLHAIAKICAGKTDEGAKLFCKLSEIVPIVSLLPRIYSILGSIKSAGFDEWVVSLNTELSKVVCLKDMAAQPTTPPANKAAVINKTTVGADKYASTIFKKAARYYERENYQAAIDSLMHIVAAESDHWVAYELLVDVMLQSGQDMDIPKQLRVLENRSALPARMMALIGHGYEASGNLEKAAAFADQALSVDSECARAWNLKGVIAYRNGNGSDAAQFFHKASECDDNWGDPWTNMGTLHWDHGDQDKALDCFETGFQLSPTSPNVATTYHIAISETGQYERAKPLFEKAVKHHPDFRKCRFLLIDILIHLKAYPKALNQIEAVLVLFGADPPLLVAAKPVRNEIGPMTIKKGKHPSLSLCMIVKNEEKYLPRCLASLKPIVDEMIIVDTGSNDSTRDIAKVFGARIFDYEWNDDFAAARNYSLEQASGEWILVMDADEVIAAQDHKNIRKLISRSKSKRSAFMIVTRNYTDQYNIVGWEPNPDQYPEEEAGAGWIPSEKVRLFPRNKGIYFEHPVHEVVGPSLSKNNISVKSCPCPVHHYGKLNQAREHQKDEHYYQIGMEKLSLSQDDPVAMREMAIQAAKLGKHEDSIWLWNRLLELQPNNVSCYINLASNHGKLKQHHKAREASQRAVKLSPNLKEALLNLGLSELHLGNIVKAENIFKQIVKKHRHHYSAIFLLGSSQFCQGNIEKGVKTLQNIKGKPMWDNLSHAFQDLVESLMAAGWSKLSRNLIVGSKALNCCNDKIKAVDRQLEMETA